MASFVKLGAVAEKNPILNEIITIKNGKILIIILYKENKLLATIIGDLMVEIMLKTKNKAVIPYVNKKY